MRMEGSGRSGVLKKKSSSGCLIIKKKGGDSKNSGGVLRGLDRNSSEKRRPRAFASQSSLSDDEESLELMRRRVNDKRSHNVPRGHKRSELENRECHANNVWMDNSGKIKRNSLDLFEFDEYDEFDGKNTRSSESVEDRFKMVGHKGDGNLKEFVRGSLSRNLMVKKRKHDSSLHDSGSRRSKGVECGGLRNKAVDQDEDDAHMPISLLRLKYQGPADEPIRLQGKNGVLKVMVNKNKKTDASQHKKYNLSEIEEGKSSRLEDAMTEDLLGQSPVYPVSKITKNLSLLPGMAKSMQKDKLELKLGKVKAFLTEGNKTRDLEVDGTDTALKLGPPGPLASISKKEVKKEDEKSPPSKDSTPVEGKAKRGGSTEKQMLREKIRGMLVSAGWTIDYRPRRNRDYLDAVYINPSGTAYWSIIKAYDAFKKQLDEDTEKSKLDIECPSFAPIADDMINKLTRQTKKKIEEEWKRKRKEIGSVKSANRSTGRETAKNSDSDQNEERICSYAKQNYKSRRGRLPEDSENDLSDDSWKRKLKKAKGEKYSIASKSNVLQGRTSKITGRCTLLVRGSDKGENLESDGYVLYRGKRTVLGWLIDSGAAQLSEKVQYMNRKRTRVMLEGWITRDGIHCGCCSKILTVSKFEMHAGSKLRQPFQNIFLESGASLLQCQLDAWNRQEESVRRDFHTVDADGDDPDDDTCGICGDGGDLMCCDSCPSTFHQTCLGIQMLPSGDWHCQNCTCKFCGNAEVPKANDSAAGDLVRCSFCDKNYHQECSKKRCTPSTTSSGLSFCSLKCQEIYDHLQKNLGIKHELGAGFSWSLIKRMDVSDASYRGFLQRVECNSKLSVALAVMDECFLPIIDRRSGISIIHNVIYNCGSNFNRLNYRGFYTVILERGDEIISAASLRIHGTRVAEMPFIGTRNIYRRQGMCRRLLTAIETELSSLKVERLLIPAIPEHMNTWTTVFGFHPLEDVVKKEIKSMNMLVFPWTDMLQKPFVKLEVSDGEKVFESNKNQTLLLEGSDVHSSIKHNRRVSGDSGVCHEIKIDEDNDPKSSSTPFIPFDANTTAGVSNSGSVSSALVASMKNNLFESVLENKQNEPLDSLNCPSNQNEGNTIADTENGSQDPHPNDDTTSSIEVVVGSTSKNRSPPLKSIGDSSGKTQDRMGLAVSVVEAAFLQKSTDCAVDNDSGECMDASSTVSNGEFLVQPNPDPNQPTDSTAAKNEGTAPCTKEVSKPVVVSD